MHLWSLGIEEQFYFFFPIVLWLAWRKRLNLLIVTSVIAVLSFSWNLYQYNTDTTALFYSPLTRFWELMIGSVLAYLTLSAKKASALSTTSPAANIRSLAGVVLLIVGTVTAGRAFAFPGAWALFPTFGAALLISAGPSAFLNKHVLSNRLMVGIGLISYPLYLWHWPLLSYARIIEGRTPSASIRTLCVVAAFVLAFVTFRFIERPLRLRVSQKSVAGLLAGVVFLVGTAGYVIYAKDGITGRSVDLREVKFEGDIGHVDFHHYVEDNFFPCTPESLYKSALTWEGAVRCNQSKPGTPIDLILLGDSHAEHLFIGLAEALPNRNVGFYIRGVPPVRSEPEFRPLYESVLLQTNIRTVVISAMWSLRGIPVRETAAMIKEFQAAGKVVFITDDTPRFNFDPSICKFKAECEQERKIFTDSLNSYSQDLKLLLQEVEGLTRITTSEYLCERNSCSMTDNKTLLFRDFDHLNINGSRFIGKKIVADYPELSRFSD